MVLFSAEQIKQVADISTGLGVLIGAGALIVNAVQGVEQRKNNERVNEAQAFQVFNERFEVFAKARGSLIERARSGEKVAFDEAVRAYARFYALHIDQWEFFKRRVIREDTYVTWMLNVLDSLAGRQDFGTFSSRDLWPAIGRRWIYYHAGLFFIFESLYQYGGKTGRLRFSRDDILDVRRKIRRLVKEACSPCIELKVAKLEREGKLETEAGRQTIPEAAR